MEKVFSPDNNKIIGYENKAASIFKKIKNNELEVAKLNQLKQLLISRISGM